MKTTLTRRHFVTSISGAALLQGTALGVLSGAAQAARTALHAEPLADGVLCIHGAGANVVALRDGAGLVFIDGGLKAGSADLMKLTQQQLGKGRTGTK